jgi:hypothetical protein
MSLDNAIARAVAEEVVRILQELVPKGHPDDLIRLPGPLEARTARALVRSKKLPATRIGRHHYTLRRHLSALVEATSTFDAERMVLDHIHRKQRA